MENLNRRTCWLWFPIRFSKYRVEKTFSGDLELICETGILNKRIDKLKLFKVNDVSYSRTMGNFFFGVSNVTIHSADKSSGTKRIVKIRKGREFMTTIEEIVATERQRMNVGYAERNVM